MKVVKVACGQSHSIALLDDGTLWTCGTSNRLVTMSKIENAPPGHNTDVATEYHYYPHVVNKQNEWWDIQREPNRIQDHVICLETFLCGEAVFAIREDGEVWGKGRHVYTKDKYAYNELTNIALPAGLAKNVISLSVGYSNIALINREHDLFIGGSNSFGQVGDGTTDDSEIPKCVLHDVRQVDLCGFTQRWSFAVTSNDQLYGWGNDKGLFLDRNKRNLVVDGSYKLLLKPQIILENVAMISASYDHILAITKTGELLSWGVNEFGQLGDGTLNPRYDPKPVFSGAKYAKAGNGCSFVVDVSGQLWACGSNSSGNLGIGSYHNSSSFVNVKFG